MRRILTILAILLLSFGGAAAACAHQALALAAAKDHNSAHHADCPSNSARGDMAVADALCDCAQPAVADTISNPLPMVLASAPIVWSAPQLVIRGADFTQTQLFHGPPRLYLLTGRLRL